MKRKTWIIIGIAVLVLLLIGINVWKKIATSSVFVETTTLMKEQVAETVIVPGTLTIKDEQLVYEELDKGTIAEVFVKEGDKVKKDDPLLRYENEQLELDIEQNKLQRRSVALQLENLRKQHREIDKEVDKDQDNELLRDEHDQIRLEEQMMNIELEQALLQKESIELERDNLTVVARVDGTVLHVDEGTNSSPYNNDSPIIRIGSLNDTVVAGVISEYDSLHIDVDQQVKITSDALLEKEWTGKVSFISDMPQESTFDVEATNESAEYAIEVTLEEDIDLRPGFHLVMEIVTKEANVDTLPISSVQQEDGDNFVYIVEEGIARKKEVKIGSIDGDVMEIVEGISADDVVILEPTDAITDGTEVSTE